MFAISKNIEYALMCLRVLSEERKVCSSRDLSDRFHIPLKLLEKILQKLAFHNLIDSTKGPSGGYTLKRAPETISLNEVVQAVYGPLHLTQCMEHTYVCDRQRQCVVRPSFNNLQGLISSFLMSTSLHDFIQMGVNKKPSTRMVHHDR